MYHILFIISYFIIFCFYLLFIFCAGWGTVASELSFLLLVFHPTPCFFLFLLEDVPPQSAWLSLPHRPNFGLRRTLGHGLDISLFFGESTIVDQFFYFCKKSTTTSLFSFEEIPQNIQKCIIFGILSQNSKTIIF